MEKDPGIYVNHILEAFANIETDIVGYDFERFRADRRTRELVERNLEILSEASRRLPNEYKEREVQIPWRAIAILWDTCQKDLKLLKDAVVRIGAVISGAKIIDGMAPDSQPQSR